MIQIDRFNSPTPEPTKQSGWCRASCCHGPACYTNGVYLRHQSSESSMLNEFSAVARSNFLFDSKPASETTRHFSIFGDYLRRRWQRSQRWPFRMDKHMLPNTRLQINMETRPTRNVGYHHLWRRFHLRRRFSSLRLFLLLLHVSCLLGRVTKLLARQRLITNPLMFGGWRLTLALIALALALHQVSMNRTTMGRMERSLVRRLWSHHPKSLQIKTCCCKRWRKSRLWRHRSTQRRTRRTHLPRWLLAKWRRPRNKAHPPETPRTNKASEMRPLKVKMVLRMQISLLSRWPSPMEPEWWPRTRWEWDFAGCVRRNKNKEMPRRWKDSRAVETGRRRTRVARDSASRGSSEGRPRQSSAQKNCAHLILSQYILIFWWKVYGDHVKVTLFVHQAPCNQTMMLYPRQSSRLEWFVCERGWNTKSKRRWDNGWPWRKWWNQETTPSILIYSFVHWCIF